MVLLLATIGHAETRVDAVFTDDAPVAVAGLRRLDGSVLAAVETGGVRIYRDGAAVDGVPGAFADVAGLDVDGDGSDDLVLCGPDGLEVALWGEFLEAPTPIAMEACSRVGVVRIGRAGLIAVGASTTLWWTDPEALLADPQVLDVEPPTWIATDGDSAAFDQGDTVAIVDVFGLSTYPVGGDVGGLAWDGSSYVVALTDRLRWLDGGEQNVDYLPGPIAAGDFDGDGALDLVVADGASVWLQGQQTFLPGPPERFVIADPQALGCASALFVSDGLYALSDPSCAAPGLVDADGDGVTFGAGDCDDQDPNVFPGAVDPCDGRDQDCDGVVDDGLPLVVRLATPGASAFEGAPLLLRADVSGCEPAAYAWTTSMACDELSPQERICTPTDEGELTARVDASRDGQVVSASASVAVLNVAPWFVTTGTDADDSRITIRVGEQASLQFRADDLGDDALVFSGEGGSAEVFPSGLVTIPADEEGSFRLDVRVDDGDGGVATREISVRVSDERDGGCCCCSGAALLVGLLPLWRRVRR